MSIHTVTQGDCLSSIAKLYGFFDYLTIWNRPENADLKRRRPDPNILVPGDRLFIPDKTQKVELGATDNRHVFVVKRRLVVIELVLKLEGEPLANKSYVLTIGERKKVGTTDASGGLREAIEPGDEAGVLRLDDPVVQWDLQIGHLDPSTEIGGVQARLNNLGHACGQVDGVVGARTRAALRQFQSRHGLRPTGAIDAVTSTALRNAHDG